MPNNKRKDPYLSFRFKVEIDGIIKGGFSEASGLEIETEIETYQEGGLNDYVHQLPKGNKYSKLTLKRGLTDSKLYDWYKNVVDGKIKRNAINIIQSNEKAEEVWLWNLNGAYPVKWKGPDFNANSNNVAFESLEIIHNGFNFSKFKK